MEVLPFELCPQSRSPSPASEDRVKQLIDDIRKNRVEELFLISSSLRGPLVAGPSRWSNPPSFAQEDLILPDNEEHAQRIESEREYRRDRCAETESAGSVKRGIAGSDPRSANSKKSGKHVVPAMPTYATSTPVSSTSQASSLTQPSIGFSIVKQSTDRVGAKGVSGRSYQSAAHASTSFSSRLASVQQATPSQHAVQGSRLLSSQGPLAYNSQFDIEAGIEQINKLLTEDGYEGPQGTAG